MDYELAQASCDDATESRHHSDDINIEAQIGDFPCDPNPDIENRLRRKWVCRLVRICREYCIPHRYFLRAAFAKHHVSKREQNLLLSVATNSQYADYLPLDAPERTARMVDGISNVALPPWCKKSDDAYGRLWMGTLLMGEGGRSFAFATARIAAAFGIKSKNTVTRFLQRAITHNHLIVARAGIAHPRGGQAALYRLANEADYDLGQRLKVDVPRLSAS